MPEEAKAVLYRRLAAEARGQAGRAADNLIRMQFLSIAASYEKLAEYADRAARP